MMQQLNPNSKAEQRQSNIRSIISTCDAQLQPCRSTVTKKGLDHLLVLQGAHTEEIYDLYMEEFLQVMIL
jgi:hypothetical protein